MIRRPVLILLLLALSTVPGVAAERLAGILPVVGSTEGAQGARFRTGLQLSNPSAGAVRGALVFREQGKAASESDPRAEFELAPRATQSFGDVVADMGASGLGSMEIVVIEGVDPVVVARAYADGEGTLGVTVPLVKVDEALEAGESATLLVPSDLSRFRFNIGVRSLGEGARLKVEVFDADGSLQSTLEEKVYPADAFVQVPSSAFAGDLLANQSLRVEVVAGAAIVYGTTTDNRTNDPSLQIDRLLNKPPVLIDQDFTRNQDGSITVELEFTDPDGDPVAIEVATAPQKGTLTTFERIGTDGWRFRALYTPAIAKAPSAAPFDQIVIIVRDGQGNVRRLIIEIPGGLNRAPTAIDASYSTNEDTSLEITLRGSDPDGDSLEFRIVTQPSLGTLGPLVQVDGTTATITYIPGFNKRGPDSFTFEVEDIVGQTDRGTITIEIRPVNDSPTAGPDSYSLLEDQVLNVPAPGVLANDADVDSSTLTAVLATGPAQGTLALSPNGSFTYTPAPDFFGTDGFTYRASDGAALSSPVAVTITVTPVNDAPSFVAGVSPSIPEDSPAQTIAGFATAISAGPLETQGLTFSASNDNNALFSVQPAVSPDGTLTYAPAPDANGSATVTLTLQDDGGTANGGIDTSASQTFTITVTAVNDAPSFTKGADQLVLEDSGAANVAGWATGMNPGPADEAGQTLTFNVTSDNNALFSVQPAIDPTTGTLTFTPAANANGVATVTVTLQDSGSGVAPNVNISAAQTFTITVTAVNDAPSFTAGANQTVAEDSGLATVNPWATAVTAGPADEAAQTLTFSVSNDNNALFAVQPSIAADGTLTFTPAPDQAGTATVSVTLQDDGGTANGGIDTSAPPATFTITVTPVNDAPSFTKGGDQIVLEDSGSATVAGWASAMSPGPADEAGQTLAFLATNDSNALFSVQPAIDATTGSLTFTPAANASGVATVTVTLQDSGSGVAPNVNTSAAQTFTITITAVNDPPSFIPGAAPVVPEDSGLVTTNPWATAISAGPADEAGQTLTFNVSNDNNALFAVQPAIAADGTLTFTPAPDQNGTATVTVTLQDNGGTANGGADTSAPPATFTITVTPVNDAPAAASQSVTTAEDIPILITLSASDIEGDALTFNAPSVPSFGNLGAVSAPSCSVAGGVSTCTATVTYTPNPDANGADSFTFTVFDGAATSDPATVTITVTPVNDAPVGNSDSYGPLAHGTTLTVAAPGVVGNDTDVDGDALSAILVGGPSFASAFTLNADGSFSYTHDRSANLSDSFTYNVSDGTAAPVGPITVTITISANLAPVATADGYPVAEGGTLNVPASGVMTNDGDPEGYPTSAALVSGPTRGILTFNADGSFGYVHDGSSTPSDSFTYQITDGLLTSAPATVTITVTQVNDAPVALGNNYAVVQSGTLAVIAPGLLGNDTDEEGSALTATLVTPPASATSFTLNPDGSFSYQHDGSGGATDSFTYRANDGTDDSNIATVTIAITAVNQVPVANDDAWSVTDGETLTVVAPGVIANDTDAEGNPLTAILDAGPSAASSFTLNADGSFTYVHDGSGAGTDSFTYHVSDGSDDSGLATVTITITATPNVAPTATDDAFAVAQGGTLTIVAPGVLGNDADTEGNALSASVVSGPTRGTLTLGTDGSFIYVHGGSSTETDTFTYLANDGQDDSNVATVTITINAVNTAPTANADGPYATSQNLPLTIPAPGILGNDTDPESDVLTPILDTAPANGLLTLNDDGSFTYIPAAGYFGPDSFTYFAFDGSLQSATAATVSITVNPNAVPVANADSYAVNEDASLSVPALTGVLSNDTDADPGDTLTAVLVSGPANASSFTLNADGSFNYTPNANYAGSDSFTYRANDGVADSSVATVTITVNSVNDAPAGADNAVTTDEDTAYAFTAADFGFTDPNDSPANALLAVRITTLPSAGSLTLSSVAVNAGDFIAVADINAGNLELTPGANGNGTPYTSFTFQVRDDGGTANGGVDLDPTPNTMTVNVTSINDAPSGANKTVAANEDATYTFTAADFGFTDPNDAPANALEAVVVATLPAAGSLTLSSVAVTAGQEVSAAAITAGTLVFTPAANASGSAYASFTFQVRDDGGTANGGIDLDPTARTITIDVTAINDAPAGTDKTVTTDEDIQYTFTAADFGFTDPNDTPANNFASVVITTLPGAGSLTLSGSGVAPGAEISVANITAGNLRFLPALNAFGTPYTSFTFQVRDDGGTANSGVDLDPSPNTITINVNPVNDPPIGGADSWETFGNTTLVVDQAALATPHVRATTLNSIGALSNDSDPIELDPIVVTGIVGCLDTVAPFNCTAAGGTVVLESNGTFAYTPSAGYTGSDSFQYVLTDVPSVGVAASVNVTVTLTVHEVVWYVDGSVTGPGTGVSTDPFNNFDSLGATGGVGDSDGPNSVIFVHQSAVTGAIELENGQKLYGEGYGLSIARGLNGGSSPTALVAAGTNPVITAPNSANLNTVSVLANSANGDRIGVEIRGVTLLAPGTTANGVDATSADGANLGVVISKVTVSAGTAEGIDVNQASTGTATVSLADVTVTSTGTGIDITRTAGTLQITGFGNLAIHGNTGGSGINVNGPAVFDAVPGGAYQPVLAGNVVIGESTNAVGGGGMLLGSMSGDLQFTDLDIFASNGAGLRVTGGGAVNAAGGTGTRVTVGAGVGIIETTGGPAVDLTNLTADLQLTSLRSTSTPTRGVSLDTVSDGTTNAVFSAGSGSVITTTAGATGPIFNVSGGNAKITYAGTITNTSSAARAVSITTWTGDDIGDDLLLSGAITESGAGILVNGNGGPARSITFSGGMTINTTTGEGFVATGNTNTGGLHITGTNTINSTSATALRVTNTTIGSSHLNFVSISSGNNTAAADPINGIVLNTTGSTGGLKVAGSGSAGTGGTIQRTTGVGVLLTSTQHVSLNGIIVQNAGDDGIRGQGIHNFALLNSNLPANGNATAENGLQFGEASGTVAGITGTLTISNTNITASAGNNVHIRNTSGTLDAMTVTGGTFNDLNDVTGANSFLFEMSGTAVNTASTISGATFSNNSPQRALEVQVHDNGTISNFTVSGTTFNDNGIHASFTQDTNGNLTFSMLNNTSMLNANPLHAINVFSSATSTGGSITGTIQGNVIGNAATANSGARGNGIRAFIQGRTIAKLLVNGNTLRQVWLPGSGARGIDLQFVGPTAGGQPITQSDVTITNNDVDTMAPASSFPLSAIYLAADNQGSPARVRANITGNNARNSVGGGSFDYPSFDGLGAHLIFIDVDGIGGPAEGQLVNTTGSPNATAQLTATNTGTVYADGITLIPGPITVP